MFRCVRRRYGIFLLSVAGYVLSYIMGGIEDVCS